MQFFYEPEPPRGQFLAALAGVGRIVAPNPGPMTYHGTNTWLIDRGQDGITVIDPGPDDPAHVQAVLGACAGRLANILLTHTHADHAGAADTLRAASGARLFGFQPAPGLTFDMRLTAGDCVSGLTALHTPGHAPDHLCFDCHGDVLFSGDHVMGWSTSVIMPPEGDMAAYMRALNLLLDRPYTLFLPGHGPAIRTPHAHLRALLDHRRGREAEILRALNRNPASVAALVRQLYTTLAPELSFAAERNVLAHLLKLRDDARVTETEGLWRPISRTA